MQFIYQIFGKLLYFIYSIVQNYGVSIIIFSIIAKLILLPFTIKQTKSMKEMSMINPELQKLQQKYKNNKQKLNEETMKLYQEHGVNPLGGCLPLLLQFPVIIGLFTVLREPHLWVFTEPGQFEMVNKAFLWLKDLGNPDPLYILPILAALTTYLSTKMTSSVQGAGNSQGQAMNKSMQMVMPVMIGWFALKFPAGLALYWVLQNILTFVQQYIMMRDTNKGAAK